jgi:hypothetical protein
MTDTLYPKYTSRRATRDCQLSILLQADMTRCTCTSSDCKGKDRQSRKIWGFHGGDYEEYRPLRYKNPVWYLTADTLRLR